MYLHNIFAGLVECDNLSDEGLTWIAKLQQLTSLHIGAPHPLPCQLSSPHFPACGRCIYQACLYEVGAVPRCVVCHRNVEHDAKVVQTDVRFAPPTWYNMVPWYRRVRRRHGRWCGFDRQAFEAQVAAHGGVQRHNGRGVAVGGNTRVPPLSPCSIAPPFFFRFRYPKSEFEMCFAIGSQQSAPSTQQGAGDPNQNTSRIQNADV